MTSGKDDNAMRTINETTRGIGKLLLNAGALSLFLTNCGSVLAAENSAGRAHRAAQVAARSDSGLYIVTFKTGSGQMRVFLPADIRPGDAIVGSTSLEPSGRQDADKDANRAVLAAYTLTLAGPAPPVQAPALKWNLPADL